MCACVRVCVRACVLEYVRVYGARGSTLCSLTVRLVRMRARAGGGELLQRDW